MKQLLKLIAKSVLMLSAATVAGGAVAQAWPSKPVRIIVPFNAGTPPDITTRIIANKLTQRLGQAFIVDNKPGASGSLGLAELDRQPADGYTALTLLTPVVVGPALIPGFNKDLAKDYVSVGQYDWTYSVLVASPSLPVNDLQGLIELIRAKPGAYNFASGGHGTPAHLAGELFKMQNNLSATHVAYNQFTAGLTDLTAGRIDFMFLTSTAAVPQVLSGKVKALAVASGEARLPALPNVPSMHELGFKAFDVRNWDGFVLRSGTPKAIADRFTAELNAVLADPAARENLKTTGADPVASTSAAEFNALIKSDQIRMADLVRKANIKID